MLSESTVSFSIVSHGQGRFIYQLLKDFRALSYLCHEIIITLNIPEDELFMAHFSDLPIRIIRNLKPKGFGANHNAAFGIAKYSHFVVVNPDVRFNDLQIELLIDQLKVPTVGIAAPVVYSSDGRLQDSARHFPTILRLLARWATVKKQSDYELSDIAQNVDWVGGMFMVFRRATYLELHGFNEKYFMYFEDVDLCKRLHNRGYNIMLIPGVRVIHDAQRASRRKFRYFIWHLTSTLRFLIGR